MLKKSIIDEYLLYDKLYINKYEKYALFMQVGSFYEIYSIDPNDIKLKDICNILNILRTQKNKSIQKINKNNPYMAGMPVHSFDKHLDKLINNNYTVITYIQYIEKNKIKRKLNNIYSIGTYINNEQLNDYYNNITSIYIDKYKNNIVIGCSTLDITIGKNNIYEFSININKDENKLYEELTRYLIINNPKEIIYISNNYNNKNLIQFLKGYTNIFHNDNILYNKEYENINYQNDFLSKIFPSTYLTPIETIHMEKYQISLISYIILLQFTYNYNNLLINNINIPDIITDHNTLILHNNALYQLDIISTNIQNKKYNSLFNTINYTLTPLGNRLLKYNLINPITDINKLNNRYNIIDILIHSKNRDKYKLYLEKIIDIERYHKKLNVNDLQPFNYAKCNESYINIINLINLSKNELKQYFNYEQLNMFNEYYEKYIYYFNINEMELFNFNLINTNIFNTNVFSDLDKIYNEIEKDIQWIKNLCTELTNLADGNLIEYYNTDRDGYFLKATNKRAKILKDKTKNHMIYKDLIYDTKIKSSTYIYYDQLTLKSNNIINNKEKIKEITYKKYIETCEYLYHKFSHILYNIHEFISILDVSYSNSILAINYNYTKPIIDNSKNESFIDCNELRHPIIEQILDNTKYISNDIKHLGYNNQNGILLYGTNGAGKSALMKSVGQNIILAQSGCYVSSNNFKYYPFTNIFTRINKHDDLFRGRSSFMVEMYELNSIFKFANKNSLVLGDEIMSTTENISALSIICASLNHFLEKNIKFIFASHIHNIYEYLNKNLVNKLFIGHLSTIIKDDKIIYERKLNNGIGEINYGIKVMQNIFKYDELFIKDALQIQNKILQLPDQILQTKKSKYNSKQYIDYCYLCKDIDNIANIKNIDIHHIQFQCEYINNNILNNIKKNSKANLVPLCKIHHDDVHKKKIKINGWIDTNIGRLLDYKYI